MQIPDMISELALHGIFCVIGLMGNTFIVTANCIIWSNRVSELNLSDFIISSLGLNTICLQCVSFASNTCFLLWRVVFLLDGVYNSFLTADRCLRSCSLWFATWLCLYYCFKIVNFNHPSFIRMKVRFPEVVPWLLLGSVVVSLAISIPTSGAFKIKSMVNPPPNISHDTFSSTSGNGTMVDLLYITERSIPFLIHVLVASLAFTLLFLSCGAIITSLYRHMRQMEQNADSFRSPRLDAHLGAVKTVKSILSLYLLFYMANALLLLNAVSSDRVGFLICKCVISAFPAMNSIILILGNSKLNKALAGILSHSNYCRREGA